MKTTCRLGFCLVSSFNDHTVPYSTIPIYWNIKSAPASPGRSRVGSALYVFSLLGPNSETGSFNSLRWRRHFALLSINSEHSKSLWNKDSPWRLIIYKVAYGKRKYSWNYSLSFAVDENWFCTLWYTGKGHGGLSMEIMVINTWFSFDSGSWQVA